ncbi:MAG TPA: quinohemoprotein amine dehydrogenase subunit gamma [Vicinamibacterales bacterium]|nr:quinohemoprotein amine dehydrogenase subunit gamma [Vicinamibacterales bacterium]
MKHLKPVNGKARQLEQLLGEAARVRLGEAARAADGKDVVALCGQVPQQPAGPHVPLGCSTMFSPGWEVDSTGGTAGLCQPVERDLFDCHMGCFWPAQVPDQLNHAPDWTKKCAAAQKDWRKIDVIFP